MRRELYTSISASTPNRMRGTSQQTNTGLLYLPPTGAMGNTTAALIEGLAVGYASVQNRSGSTGSVGLAGRLPNRLWIAGQYTHATTTFTNDTTDAQSTAAGDFPMETTTANDGFIVASPVKFGAISLRVTTASVGAGAVRDLAYSSSDGTTWTTITNVFIQDGATSTIGLGEALIVFEPPVDWGLTASTLATGLPSGMYAFRVRATTAPSTAAVAACMEIFKVALCTEAILDNSVWEFAPSEGEARFSEADALVPIFETANAGNRATTHVRSA